MICLKSLVSIALFVFLTTNVFSQANAIRSVSCEDGRGQLGGINVIIVPLGETGKLWQASVEQLSSDATYTMGTYLVSKLSDPNNDCNVSFFQKNGDQNHFHLKIEMDKKIESGQTMAYLTEQNGFSNYPLFCTLRFY